jgi:hypothetical protein
MAAKCVNAQNKKYFRLEPDRRFVDAETLVKLVQSVAGGSSVPAHMNWLRPDGLEQRLVQHMVVDSSLWDVLKWTWG